MINNISILMFLALVVLLSTVIKKAESKSYLFYIERINFLILNFDNLDHIFNDLCLW